MQQWMILTQQFVLKMLLVCALAWLVRIWAF